MRSGTRLYSFCLIAFSFCVPFSVFADTIIDADSEISENTVWTKTDSPYIVQGWLMVDQGATLSIEPGVVVQFDSGGIDVLGRLLVKGTSDEPVTFTSASGSEWGGIQFSNPEAASSLDNIVVQYARDAITDFYSKDLSISNAKVENGAYGITAYGSHLSLDTFSAENMSSEALDISYGSDVILKNITLKNIHEGIDLYFDSKADISNLSVEQTQNQALVIYIGSSAHIVNSTISNTGWPDAIAVFNSSFLTAENVKVTNGTGDGVVVFNGSSVTIQDSVISGFTQGTGAADYGGWMDIPNVLSLTNNEITNNDTGIGLYADNSSYAISNNSIHQNVSYGLEVYGTAAVDVSHNFWGDSSGPYNDPDNLAGT
ncbi:MAG: right-handed parallel beta-helix repeat-containing protein, partial [bacterium]|nr:right-handed parallel beta-helix repeat-containing protein [bacterium]